MSKVLLFSFVHKKLLTNLEFQIQRPQNSSSKWTGLSELHFVIFSLFNTLVNIY